MKTKDHQRILEIVAVVLTGLGKFVFMDILNLKFAYIITIILFWVGYIVYRYKQDKNIIQYWGLNKKNRKKTFLELLPIAIFVILGSIVIGNNQGTNILNWQILPILLLYPIWGIIQQFIMIGIFARNMKDIKRVNISEPLIIFLTASLFSIVHYPFPLLILGTFVLALVYTTLYFKQRNLLIMGVYHGWIGAFFFYTMLERDPFQEVFGVFIVS